MFISLTESPPVITVCTDDMFRCNNGSCLNRTRICDLTKDCADAEDEGLDCGEFRKFLSLRFFSFSFDSKVIR